MRIETKKSQSRNKKRTLLAFSTALFNLVQKQSFEKVTVNQICEIADYPRSTFYNYFEDKFDLLDYCWSVLLDQINIPNTDLINIQTAITIYFDREYDFIKDNMNTFEKILRNNPSNFLSASLNNYIIGGGGEMFEHIFTDETDMPKELLLNHCFATITIVLDWIFIKHHDLSKEQAHVYLANLYGI